MEFNPGSEAYYDALRRDRIRKIMTESQKLEESRSDATRLRIFAAVSSALNNAYAKHGTEQWGRHEFYGILLEEMDELWDAIKRDEPMENVIGEAIDIAVVIVRYMETGDRYWGQHPDFGSAP